MALNVIKHNLTWKSGLKKRLSTKKIVLHCTASKEGTDFSVEGIHRLHQNNGWSGIGYNVVIYRDGTVHEGRPIDCVGAHCPEDGGNTAGVGVVYVGGVGRDGKAKDTRTEAQKKALCEVVYELQKMYPNTTIHGHNEYAKKACPSFSVKDWIVNEYEPWKRDHTNIDKCNLK